MNRSEQKELIIGSNSSNELYWNELWSSRELLWILAKKDISVRYRQTVLGFLWSILRPLMSVMIFTLVFNKVAALTSTVPYPILVLSGLLPWQLFSSIVNDSSGSILSNSGIVSKVYFPRLVFPLSSVALNFVDFAISFCILFVVMVLAHVNPTIRLFAVPFLILLTMLCGLGIALIFSALNIRYRDFRVLIPFALQMGIYVSPIGYSSALVPEKWKFLYYLNPLVGIIDAFRWCLFGQGFRVDWNSFFITQTIFLGVLFLGIQIFRKTEKKIADFI